MDWVACHLLFEKQKKKNKKIVNIGAEIKAITGVSKILDLPALVIVLSSKC